MYSFSEIRWATVGIGRGFPTSGFKYGGFPGEGPQFLAPKSRFGKRAIIAIHTDSSARSPFGKDTVDLAPGVGVWSILVIKGKLRFFNTIELIICDFYCNR